MIAVLVCTVFTLTSMTVFAAEGAPETEAAEPSVKEQLVGLKDELVGAIKDLWSFIMDNKTYKNIFTAIVAIIAFLLLPIIIGVFFVAYLIIAAMTIVAAALSSAIQMIIGIVAKFFPV